MVYKIQQSAAKKPENQFEFQMPDSDKVYSVPLLQFISPKLILSLGDVSDPSSQMTFTQKLLEYYSTDGMPLLDLFDDGQQMMDWFEAWQEASTISLGGIESLGNLLKEHRGAINRDLLEHGLTLTMFGDEPYTWAEFYDFVSYESLDSALGTELMGLPDGVRFGNLLQSRIVDQFSAFVAGLSGSKPHLLDLAHLGRQNEPNKFKLRHTPDRLPVKEMMKRIGWDEP